MTMTEVHCSDCGVLFLVDRESYEYDKHELNGVEPPICCKRCWSILLGE